MRSAGYARFNTYVRVNAVRSLLRPGRREALDSLASKLLSSNQTDDPRIIGLALSHLSDNHPHYQARVSDLLSSRSTSVQAKVTLVNALRDQEWAREISASHAIEIVKQSPEYWPALVDLFSKLPASRIKESESLFLSAFKDSSKPDPVRARVLEALIVAKAVPPKSDVMDFYKNTEYARLQITALEALKLSGESLTEADLGVLEQAARHSSVLQKLKSHLNPERLPVR